MIKLNVYGVNFEELNINNLSKRGVFDSLKTFWNGDEMSYVQYLESIGINYYSTLDNVYSVYSFNKSLNEEIEKFKYAIENKNSGAFDFKAIPLFTNRNLPAMQDNQYLKLTFDLRELQDQSKLQQIKDAFIETDSVSLVDFKEIGDDSLTLVFHRRGAMKYFDDYILNVSKDKVQLLEKFKVVKDNSFIVARFLLDLSHKLKELGIDESFGYYYEQGTQKKEISNTIDEIIFWGGLNLDEKEQQKALERDGEEIAKSAKDLAKAEIKEERDSKRDSLPKDSTIQVIQTEKQLPKVFNIISMSELDSNSTSHKETQVPNIDKIIEDSFSLYTQKEFEKTKIRLEKAQKDAKEAYRDLKDSLNNGFSINEALKTLTQKYRNDDTVNFASLLFTRDILNLKVKEQEIISLKNELDIAKKAEDELLEQITKREETISKQKGTIQLKVNEMTKLKEEFEKELETFREIDSKIQVLEKYSKEQDEIISDLNLENQELNNDLKEAEQYRASLKAKNEYLEQSLKEKNKKIELLEQEIKDSYKYQIELENLRVRVESQNQKNDFLEQEAKKAYVLENKVLKLELENSGFKDKEKILQEQIDYLKSELNKRNQSNDEARAQRSKDILG